MKEHISINDEERQRQGYELQTCYCFDQRQPVKSKLMLGDAVLAMLTYAPSARIWRINKGWSRRSDRNTLGFVINPSNGKWSKEETLEAEAAGLQGTGIGCFFDDDVHQLIGLNPEGAWQDLYHFTVGKAVLDERLQSEPAYAHLAESRFVSSV